MQYLVKSDSIHSFKKFKKGSEQVFLLSELLLTHFKPDGRQEGITQKDSYSLFPVFSVVLPHSLITRGVQ